MARTLQKIGDDGPLVRPDAVEAQIDAALTLTPQPLRARLAITNPRDADHLRSETLVHLVRHGRRTGVKG